MAHYVIGPYMILNSIHLDATKIKTLQNLLKSLIQYTLPFPP